MQCSLVLQSPTEGISYGEFSGSTVAEIRGAGYPEPGKRVTTQRGTQVNIFLIQVPEIN